VSAAATVALRLHYHARDDRGNLLPLPDHVAGLSPRARHLWEILAHVADDAGTSYYGQDQLARRMGVHPDTVWRAARELQRAGIVTVIAGGGRTHTNLYAVPVGCPQPPRQRGGSTAETPAPTRRNPRAHATETPAPTRGEVTEEVTEEAAPLTFDGMPTWAAGQIGRILSTPPPLRATVDHVPDGATWDDYG
jgi:hypothetical protein